jgi:site-specific DNA recombinase
LPKIVEEQAKIVRIIYKLFLEGYTTSGIAKLITGESISTPAGKQKWQGSTVKSILTNEKYKGDAILQKKYTVDFLTKKQKVNEGEVPQYYVENSHPAIITPEVFDMVQHEIKRRKTIGYTSRTSCFSSKIICGECGGFYGPKVWHSTSKYRHTIWQCNQKFKNDDNCRTTHLYEDDLKRAFVDAFNSIVGNKKAILADYNAAIKAITDNTVLDAESAQLENESEVMLELIRKCVDENAHVALDQTDYQRRYYELATWYEATKKRLTEIDDQRLDRRAKREKLVEFIDILRRSDGFLTEFNEKLWNATVESVTVHSEHELTFKFEDGTELLWKI